MSWDTDFDRLVEHLRGTPLVVAFSGGQDSGLVLAAAREALGPDRVLALTAVSPSQPSRETRAAGELARRLDAPWQQVPTDELSLPEYAGNPPDRCYHCKRVILSALQARGQTLGFQVFADGTNADDTGDHRPGRRAVQEAGVLSPLKELGLGKAEIRAMLKGLGLPIWDKPAAACLASRIPYGTRITKELLGRIEQVEDMLADAGFPLHRARHHGDLLRLEVAPDMIEALLARPLRDELVKAIKALGYRWVTVDMQGYRTGSLNEALDKGAQGPK